MPRYSFFLLLVLVFVGCGNPTPTVPPSPTPLSVTALADVTLRTGPSMDYDEVTQVPKDTAVELLGAARGRDCANWVLVRTSAGEEGWVVPILVNVDISKSVIPPAPTPVSPATPMPATCTGDMALVQIDNNVGKTLEAYMAGPEPGFAFSVENGAFHYVCLAPGEYCYDLTDGEKHETGGLYLPGGECTCWHWGGGPPQAGSCQCPDDPDSYQRP